MRVLANVDPITYTEAPTGFAATVDTVLWAIVIVAIAMVAIYGALAAAIAGVLRLIDNHSPGRRQEIIDRLHPRVRQWLWLEDPEQ